ncbi:hypothetical protein Tco_1123610 [Tanacetum coccineum]|uniref:Uncharacterized protein n=1 Tax=Tanacetum coccineum TaxID=301880 RepID=A0ABQ5J5A3_9ASTR
MGQNNDELGDPRSQSGWKTSWAKKDDKEDQCASRVEDSSNTNQWGKTNDESGTPRSQSGWKTSWAKKDDKEDQWGHFPFWNGKLLGQEGDKEDQCASRVEDSSNTNQWGKTNDESGTPRSQSGWKTSWAKKDDKEDNVHPRNGRFFKH